MKNKIKPFYINVKNLAAHNVVNIINSSIAAGAIPYDGVAGDSKSGHKFERWVVYNVRTFVGVDYRGETLMCNLADRFGAEAEEIEFDNLDKFLSENYELARDIVEDEQVISGTVRVGAGIDPGIAIIHMLRDSTTMFKTNVDGGTKIVTEFGNFDTKNDVELLDALKAVQLLVNLKERLPEFNKTIATHNTQC